MNLPKYSNCIFNTLQPDITFKKTMQPLDFKNKAIAYKDYTNKCDSGQYCSNASPNTCIADKGDQTSLCIGQSVINYLQGGTTCYSTSCGDTGCDCRVIGSPPSIVCAGNWCDGGCTTNWTVTCGEIDGLTSCSIGSAAGNCVKCVQNEDWGLSDNTQDPQGQQGWINCLYSYDFANYDQIQLHILTQWITDLYNGLKNNITDGCAGITPDIVRDRFIIYGVLSDTYNMIYNRGNYASQKINNPFKLQQYNYLTKFTSFKQDMINKFLESFGPIYPNGVVPTVLSTNMFNIITLPKPTQNGDNYTLTFSLCYNQFNEFKLIPDKNAYFTELINGILNDSAGILTVNNNQITINPPSFEFDENTSFQGFTVINILDYSYQIQSEIPTDSTSFFCTAEYTVTVKTWSPMLLIYFAALGNAITFSQNIATKISQDTYTYPLSTYQLNCSGEITDNNYCKTSIQQFCPVSYFPPHPFDKSITEQFILTSDSKDCLCYNSGIPPPDVISAGNPGGMCFNKNCDSRMKSLFNLNESTCQPYCNEVWEWMNSSGMDQSKDPKEFDPLFFQQSCGEKYEPDTPKTLNLTVIYSGIPIAIFVAILIFVLGKKYQISTFKSILLSIFSLLFIGVLVGFLTRDLAGVGSCKTIGLNGKFVCRSRITNKEIPIQFCDYKENCECTGDQDCSGNCVCYSTTCVPKSGWRKQHLEQTTQVNIPQIISIILCTIILVIITYNSGLLSGKFLALAIIAIIILGAILVKFLSIKKEQNYVFDGPCCSPNCPSNSCNLDDGCGEKCAVCPLGQSCQNGVCSPCECSSNCLGGSCPTGQSCENGVCVACTCSPTCINGACPLGQGCVYGNCATCNCSPKCPGGVCPTGQGCQDGVCAFSGLLTITISQYTFVVAPDNFDNPVNAVLVDISTIKSTLDKYTFSYIPSQSVIVYNNNKNLCIQLKGAYLPTVQFGPTSNSKYYNTVINKDGTIQTSSGYPTATTFYWVAPYGSSQFPNIIGESKPDQFYSSFKFTLFSGLLTTNISGVDYVIIPDNFDNPSMPLLIAKTNLVQPYDRYKFVYDPSQSIIYYNNNSSFILGFGNTGGVPTVSFLRNKISNVVLNFNDGSVKGANNAYWRVLMPDNKIIGDSVNNRTVFTFTNEYIGMGNQAT